MNIEVSILIPFLNESENIPDLVSGLNAFCSRQDESYEVIFIDDGSTDDSCQKLKNAPINGFSCSLIQLSQNYGSHAALRAGITKAKGKYISFAYADLQDPLTLQKRMYDKAESSSSNIIRATRKDTKSSTLEKLFSQFYASMMKKHVKNTFPEKGFDIVMFDAKVQQQLNINIESNSSIFLQILTLGFKQNSIEYEKSERQKGKSKWTLKAKIKLFIDSFVAFSYFPIRLVTMLGILFSSLGFLWTIYIISRKLISDDLEPGWPAIISILMIGFGVTNIGLGIIAEYLWRTLDTSRKRPVFVIDELIKIK